uniref:Cytochrome b5 heme-binding domain-containing protein n=1 Tax=Zooxanthella nutricula TaxID=1333877 RepID=A0A6V0FKM6_9DINO|mmetsp:Transcript_88339/g.270348  ORF Transcript_88339/g.270348 Transcript_88339/m.270348 type:complete len:157 (+) Transcript_88339:150-620(+)
MAVVSADHADESLNAERIALPSATLAADGRGQRSAPGPRLYSPEEVRKHSEPDQGSFWAVIDGFVVDASEFVQTHPGGLKKLLSADSAATGATGRAFGFSFSRGRNAHFPQTGRRFRDGVEQYLSGKGDDAFLPPADVAFPPFGKLVILGQLDNGR